MIQNGGDAGHLTAHGLQLGGLFQLGRGVLEAGLHQLFALLGQFGLEFVGAELAQFLGGEAGGVDREECLEAGELAPGGPEDALQRGQQQIEKALASF